MDRSMEKQIEQVRQRHLARKKHMNRRRRNCDALDSSISVYRRKRRKRLQMRLDSSTSAAEKKRIRRAIRLDVEGDTGWITLENGNHVMIENGTVTGGAEGSLNGTTLSNAESKPLSELQESSGKSSSSSSSSSYKSSSSSSSSSSKSQSGSIAGSATISSNSTLTETLSEAAKNAGRSGVKSELEDLSVGTMFEVYNAAEDRTIIYTKKENDGNIMQFETFDGDTAGAAAVSGAIERAVRNGSDFAVYDADEETAEELSRLAEEGKAKVAAEAKAATEKRESLQNDPAAAEARVKEFEKLSSAQDKELFELPKGASLIDSNGDVWVKEKVGSITDLYSDLADRDYDDWSDEERELWDEAADTYDERQNSCYVNVGTGEKVYLTMREEWEGSFDGMDARVYDDNSKAYEDADAQELFEKLSGSANSQSGSATISSNSTLTETLSEAARNAGRSGVKSELEGLSAGTMLEVYNAAEDRTIIYTKKENDGNIMQFETSDGDTAGAAAVSGAIERAVRNGSDFAVYDADEETAEELSRLAEEGKSKAAEETQAASEKRESLQNDPDAAEARVKEYEKLNDAGTKDLFDLDAGSVVMDEFGDVWVKESASTLADSELADLDAEGWDWSARDAEKWEDQADVRDKSVNSCYVNVGTGEKVYLTMREEWSGSFNGSSNVKIYGSAGNISEEYEALALFEKLSGKSSKSDSRRDGSRKKKRSRSRKTRR